MTVPFPENSSFSCLQAEGTQVLMAAEEGEGA